MGVYLRGDVCWIEFIAGKKRYRESAKTADPKEAQKLLERRRAEITLGQWRAPGTDAATVGDAIDRLLAAWETRQVKSRAANALHLRQAQEALGGTKLKELNAWHISTFADGLAKRYVKGTVKLKLQFFHAALQLAVDTEMLAKVPKFPVIDASDSIRRGFVDIQQFDQIAAKLQKLAHQDAARFAFFSAWRYSEVTGLEWKNIYLRDREVHLFTSKNKKRRVLPLDGELLAIVEQRAKERLLSCPYVFHVGGRSIINTLDRAWRKARTAAGFPSVVFHDLRRSGLRAMLQAGVPQAVAKKVSGHESDQVFARYNIVTTDDIRQALQQTAISLAERRTHRSPHTGGMASS
jgi:integrase